MTRMFADGKEIGVHGLFHLEQVDNIVRAKTISYPIVAKPVEGYTFVFWLHPRTEGWVGSTYIDGPNMSKANIWISNPASDGLNIFANGVNSVSAFAVYIKNSVA